MTPKFISPDPKFIVSENSKFFLYRNQFQIIRYDLPLVSKKDAKQIINFKLKSVYPHDFNSRKKIYFWFKYNKSIIGYVLLFQNDSKFYDQLIVDERLLLPFPLQIKSEKLQNSILIYTHRNNYEVCVIQNGYLLQSHNIILGEVDFIKLLESLKEKHQNYPLVYLEQNNFSNILDLKIFDLKIPFLEVFDKNIPPVLREEAPYPFFVKKIHLRLILIFVFVSIFLGKYLIPYTYAATELEKLTTQMEQLISQKGGNDGLKEKVEALEKKIASVRKEKSFNPKNVFSDLLRILDKNIKIKEFEIQNSKFKVLCIVTDILNIPRSLDDGVLLKKIIIKDIKIDTETGKYLFIMEGIVINE